MTRQPITTDPGKEPESISPARSAVVISRDGRTATFKGDSVIHSRSGEGWGELPARGGDSEGECS